MSIKSFAALAVLALLMSVGASELLAQPPPPALPSMPDQAPIDGGLGLLAASGAAYAWKKLRPRQTK
jgi:hypothetical protein